MSVSLHNKTNDLQLFREHGSFLTAALFFIVVVIFVYPFYQYYVDPDATAYLTLAKRYAEGDYEKAINGYWSPWSVWLTALLMKVGIASFKSAIIINAVGAVGFLWVSHAFFLMFHLQRDLRWLLSGALAVFLVYAVFWQSFDDLWECFFLLLVLRIILKDDFCRKPLLWVVTGFVGALAYFAKSYSLPFFILEMIVCLYFVTEARLKPNRALWLKIVVVCIISMIAFSFPWIYLLHSKYGVWMTGTAGMLNTSWYLIGHPYWTADILHLLPPVYADSPSYWEDPYVANGATPHFWNSPRLLLLQVVRIGYNALKFVQSITELSCFFGMGVVVAMVVLFSKKVQARLDKKFTVVCVSFLLFPLGYLLVHFQARYLWYMLPLCMIILAVSLQRLSLFHQINKTLQKIIAIVFAFSFIVYPVLGLKNMYREGWEEYKMAQALKAAPINGSFTTNIPYSSRTQHIVRLSYFSGNSYYNMPLPTAKEDLLKEMRRYKVNYYFHFYDGEWDDFQLRDEFGRPFPEIAQGSIPGIKVFRVF
ncbi:MAG TPA: hypothetical protein PL009_04815 [Flavipsychrobacter sp.]|nr:hypothetical protein [Flavipsychrobacter sp.]